MSETKEKRPLLRLFPVLLCNLIAFGITIPILPGLVEEFGGAGMEVGAMFTFQALGQLLTATFWGSLSDRFGRKPILLITILGAIALDIVSAQCMTLEGLYLARFVAGLFSGTIATASSLITDVTDAKSRSKGMAIIGISFGLGFTIGPGLGAGASYLAEVYGLGRGFPLVCAAGWNVFTLILGFFLLVEGTSDRSKRASNREEKSLKVILSLMERTRIRDLSIFFLGYSLCVTILETTFYLYMADRYGYTERQVGLFFAGMGLLGAVVQGMVGRISAKIGDHRMTMIGVLLLAVSLMVSTAWEVMGYLIFWLAVSSIGRALLQPGAMSLMSRQARHEEETGKIMGVMQSAQSAGRIIGPVLGGVCFDQIGRRSPFVAAGIILAAVGIYWSISERRRQVEEIDELQ